MLDSLFQNFVTNLFKMSDLFVLRILALCHEFEGDSYSIIQSILLIRFQQSWQHGLHHQDLKSQSSK